jgi:hypothetical protein
MADISTTVITPAASYDLATLDEVKMMIGIPSTDTTEDAMLSMWITGYSESSDMKRSRKHGAATPSHMTPTAGACFSRAIRLLPRTFNPSPGLMAAI